VGIFLVLEQILPIARRRENHADVIGDTLQEYQQLPYCVTAQPVRLIDNVYPTAFPPAVTVHRRFHFAEFCRCAFPGVKLFDPKGICNFGGHK
jgi:hypothetical protein